ncbi:MAG: hypothetical protein LBC06_01055 [Rickettsiales bacterium]|jgi:hypothetical protein|nr:hypothetical protein [Rickettsiales bacterium]
MIETRDVREFIDAIFKVQEAGVGNNIFDLDEIAEPSDLAMNDNYFFNDEQIKNFLKLTYVFYRNKKSDCTLDIIATESILKEIEKESTLSYFKEKYLSERKKYFDSDFLNEVDKLKKKV